MKKTINYQKELPIDDNVSSITSISLECSYNERGSNVEGVFLVEGSYKTHELSLNKKDFKFELPFNEELENFKAETTNVEIEDFTYELEDNKLKINIDYELEYEDEEIQEEFNEEEFERFLSDHEVDVVSFKEDENDESIEIREEVEEVEEPVELNIIEQIPEIEEEREVIIEPIISNESVEETLINNISKEEKYITYHVYVCGYDDTIESISEKFNITKEEIHEYNEFEEIKFGLKLIIPVSDE